MVLRLILWSGVLVLFRRDADLSGICEGEWITFAATPVTVDDVGAWPYSVGILMKWVAFLWSLHWPAAGANLYLGGVSFVEVLILYELWAGVVRACLGESCPLVLEARTPNFSVGCSVWSRH